MDIVYYVLALLVGVIIGYIIVSIMKKKSDRNKISSAENISRRIIDDANRDAENIKKESLLTAKEEVYKLKQNIELEETKKRNELSKQEQRLNKREDLLDKKEDSLDKKSDKLDRKQESLNAKLKNVEEKELEIDESLAEQKLELEKIASLTNEEAKQIVLDMANEEAEHQRALIVRDYEARIKEDQNKLAREVITRAVQRQASDVVAQSSVTLVTLPNDDMKGRIIGKEGRNIRSFENITGVDVIIDDTPEAVVLSSYDPKRREIATITLEKLMIDGRIHPARIEEVYELAVEEVEDRIRQYGEDAAERARVHGLPNEIIRTLGTLNFRTSYGQNVLEHSVEVANIAGNLATELGINSRTARRAGLLHDIGKALDQEIEGTHVEIGVRLLRKYKINEEIVHCVEAHHFDVPFKSLEAMVVQAADAISAARPGARRESIEAYLQRLSNLEEIANSYDGIKSAYAIQAGREIRVIVEPDKISDDKITLLSKEIAQRIEEELEYPGKIKVHVIREIRASAYAK